MHTATSSPLTPLWRIALSRPLHSPNCGCTAPTAIRLDPVGMELDLLDYLQDRFGLQALPAWREALARREAARQGDFPGWLESLRGACLDQALHEQIMAAAAATLRGMTEHAAGRLAPASQLGKGWLGG